MVSKEGLVASGRSRFLRMFGSCSLCPIRESCDHRSLLSESAQSRGCDDIRRIFFESIKRWKKPVAVLVRNAAEVRARIMMQQLKDGENCEIASKEWHKLMELELKIADKLLRYDRDGNSQKYQDTGDYSPLSDKVIELEPDAYDSDVIPDKAPELHGNVLNPDEYKERKGKELVKEERGVTEDGDGLAKGTEGHVQDAEVAC